MRARRCRIGVGVEGGIEAALGVERDVEVAVEAGADTVDKAQTAIVALAGLAAFLLVAFEMIRAAIPWALEQALMVRWGWS